MDDIQPTARWANRMLRPLTSIYRRLEKHHETLAVIAAESRTQDRNEAPNTYAPMASEVVTAPDSYSGSDADEDDPVWIPGKKPEKRRVRHKYSRQGEGQAGRKRTRVSIHSPDAPRTLPGAIELATPLINGKRWELPSSARSQYSVEQAKLRHRQEQLQVFRDKYPLHKSPWQELLDQTGDSGFASIAHNLDRVFTNFLRNTRIPKRDSGCLSGKPDRGARSLLSMVVRRLPEFIASEQEAQDELDENDDEDMCNAYFTELESFYAPHGKGWRPLREAVRAQGIFLVSTMIRRKWVTDPIACTLIENCRLDESDDACESLLATFLSSCTGYPYPQALKPTAGSSLPGDPIRLLRRYACSSFHRSYVFDELAKLLSRGVLPPEWMATKLWTSWMTRATISFSKGDVACSAAARLIEAVLVSASDIRTIDEPPKPKKRGRPPKRGATAGRPTRASSTALAIIKSEPPRPCPLLVEDALSNHVTSLMAALCGMHISRSREVSEEENVDGAEAEHIIRNLSFALERALAAKPPSHVTNLTSNHLLRRGCILLSDCLLQCNDAVLTGDTRYVMAATPTLEKLCETLTPRLDLVKELALFLRQAFRCFGSSTDFERLYTSREVRRMVSMLVHLADAPGLSRFLGRVGVETAMQFAEGTGEPDDHLWAVEIQETVIALQNGQRLSFESSDGPDGQGQPRGYRWEESIGEWVARTPAVKASAAPIIWTKTRASIASDDSPCIPCSTDTSSPETDRFQDAASSLTSSPPSGGTKRAFECIDSSPLHPAKRRQSTRVVVIENNERRRCASRPASARSGSPALVPNPPERRVLRELPNRSRPARATSARNRAASKIEVVVIHKKETRRSEEPVQSPTEPAEKQIHREVERRRPSRPRLSSLPSSPVRAVFERRSVVPCSQDDSDDELSFM